jgi:hypothetical protein
MLIRSIRRVAITSICVAPLFWAPSSGGQQAVRDDPFAPRNPWNHGGAPTSRPASRFGYRSPYRPQSFERPFDDVQIGPNRGRTIDPYGRIWMNF